MSKTAIGLGISALNEQNQKVAEQKVISIVQRILGINKNIEALNEGIANDQKALKELADPCITEAKVLGGTLPAEASRNMNQKTIAKVLEELVKTKQGCVEQKALALTQSIARQQADVEAYNKDVAKMREELAKVEVQVVKDSDILG